jgi:receptor protein-tyrosine kinase
MTAPATLLKTPQANERSIGAMLVDSGKLTLEQAEQVMRLQKQNGIRFGEAAKLLNLASDEDIQFALARQYGYAYLRRGEGKVDESLIAAYEPYSKPVEALRALRSQLMLRWFDADEAHKMLAIASPGRGDGRSWLTANLAIIFSQLGERTLLIDADLRHGCQHNLFKLNNQSGLSTLLAGRTTTASVQRVPSFLDLSVFTCGPTPPNPQELLGRDMLDRMLGEFAKAFDVVLIDTPAGDDYADVQSLSARAGGTLLLARKHHGRLAALQRMAFDLQSGSTSIVGTVLIER